MKSQISWDLPVGSKMLMPESICKQAVLPTTMPPCFPESWVRRVVCTFFKEITWKQGNWSCKLRWGRLIIGSSNIVIREMNSVIVGISSLEGEGEDSYSLGEKSCVKLTWFLDATAAADYLRSCGRNSWALLWWGFGSGPKGQLPKHLKAASRASIFIFNLQSFEILRSSTSLKHTYRNTLIYTSI